MNSICEALYLLENILIINLKMVCKYLEIVSQFQPIVLEFKVLSYNTLRPYEIFYIHIVNRITIKTDFFFIKINFLFNLHVF